MKTLTEKETASFNSYRVRRPSVTLPFKPDEFGWLKGSYEHPLGLVEVQSLFAAEADGRGYTVLRLIVAGREFRFFDYVHRTRTQLIRLCSRFVTEVATYHLLA